MSTNRLQSSGIPAVLRQTIPLQRPAVWAQANSFPANEPEQVPAVKSFFLPVRSGGGYFLLANAHEFATLSCDDKKWQKAEYPPTLTKAHHANGCLRIICKGQEFRRLTAKQFRFNGRLSERRRIRFPRRSRSKFRPLSLFSCPSKYNSGFSLSNLTFGHF